MVLDSTLCAIKIFNKFAGQKCGNTAPKTGNRGAVDRISVLTFCRLRHDVRTEMVSAFFSEYYVHLFTSLTLYTTQRNEMTTSTKSLSSSNGLTRPIRLSLTATTRLLASTVSQPAVMPSLLTTTYGLKTFNYDQTWGPVDSSISHVTSRDVQGSDAAKRDANVCSLYAACCLARIISDPHP